MNLKSLVERVDWRLLLIFILVAAIVHVLETFLAVNDQRNAAYARLARELPHNTMTIADPVTPRGRVPEYSSCGPAGKGPLAGRWAGPAAAPPAPARSA